ncbi:MAG: hypothetical protein PHR07_03915 [Acidaminococcaceae bacterium]|nr:hypothetical protein [Acidaminococcaceae bacterium]
MEYKRAISPFDMFKMHRKFSNISFPTNAGWAAAVTGTGATYQTLNYTQVTTGATAGSTALLYGGVGGLSAGGSSVAVNCAKRFSVRFAISCITLSADHTRYLQIKAANTIGDLGAAGMGIKIVNDKLYAESFGTERGEIELMTIATATAYEINIQHDPVAGTIKWYVNGVLKGTQSTAVNIPVAAIAAANVLSSVSNGGAAQAGNMNVSSMHFLMEV